MYAQVNSHCMMCLLKVSILDENKNKKYDNRYYYNQTHPVSLPGFVHHWLINSFITHKLHVIHILAQHIHLIWIHECFILCSRSSLLFVPSPTITVNFATGIFLYRPCLVAEIEYIAVMLHLSSSWRGVTNVFIQHGTFAF